MNSAEPATASPTPVNPQRSYVLSRWMFMRLLGLVYLIAFWSLGVPVVGLVGEHGVLPIGRFLDAARNAYGRGAYWQAPTLCWFSANDAMLRSLCVAGVILAALVILNVATRWVLVLLWGLYLSLAVAGQTFL